MEEEWGDDGEDGAVIERILGASSPHEVLGVAGGASAAELRRSYLRMALLVHPDKNAHPQAAEAFQRVAAAYDQALAVLKRRSADFRGLGGRAQMGPEGADGNVIVIEVPLDEALSTFATAMAQYAEEQGIEVQEERTVFDSIASAFLYVDSWVNPISDGEEQQHEDNRSTESADTAPAATRAQEETEVEEQQPQSRLQTWARNLMAFSRIVSTASQIIRVQREREEEQERSVQSGRGGGTAQTSNS